MLQLIHDGEHVSCVCGAINDSRFCDFDAIAVSSSARNNQTVTIPFDEDVGHDLAFYDPLKSGATESIEPRKRHGGAALDEKQAQLAQDKASGRGFPDFSEVPGVGGTCFRRGEDFQPAVRLSAVYPVVEVQAFSAVPKQTTGFLTAVYTACS